MNSFNIDYYFSSPYKRAFETINSSPIQFDKIVLDNPVTRAKNYPQDLLKILSLKNNSIFMAKSDKSLIGGESNREALNRILDLFEDLEERYSDKTILLSSHGNLLGILINHFDSSFDYKKWGQMTFPDCFLVDKDKSVKKNYEKLHLGNHLVQSM